jgi:CRP/FNR family nitrogen fixation transcriptional regulator
MLEIIGSHTLVPTGKEALWKIFRYGRSAEIFGEAEPADYIYQIKSGAVRTFKLLPDGRRQISSFHLPGDIFGIENGSTHRFTAEAILETKVLIAGRERVFGDDQEMCVFSNRELLKLIADSLERAEIHVLLLGRQSAPERVAAFLLDMDQRLRSPEILVLPILRRDIADYLGLTHETVTRCFSMLRDQRVLSYSGVSHRQIVVHDRAKLAQLANGHGSKDDAKLWYSNKKSPGPLRSIKDR